MHPSSVKKRIPSLNTPAHTLTRAIGRMWQRYQNVGVSDESSVHENARIRLLNRIFIGLLPLLTIVFLLYAFVFRHVTGMVLMAVVLGIYSLGLVLTRLKLHHVSRLLITIPVIVCLDIFTCIYGRTAGGSISFLLIGVAVLILFDQRRLRVLILGLLLCSFLFTEWYLFHNQDVIVAENTKILPFLVFSACMFTMVAMMIYYEESFTRFRNEASSLIGVLQEKNHLMRQSNYELAHFAHAASHHFKGPLKNISNLLGLLERRLKTAKETGLLRYIDLVKGDARHLYQLVEDLLFYSKVGEKRMPITGETVRADSELMMKQVTANLREVIKNRKARIRWNGTARLPMKAAHAELLLQNLIENGIKYNESVVPHVKVSFWHQGGSLMVEVSDNGIGISPEYRESVFHMFNRLHRREDFEGTGIGLAVCRKIMLMYGGSISVADAELGGARFLVKLPVIDSEPASDLPSGEVQAEAASAKLPWHHPVSQPLFQLWNLLSASGTSHADDHREKEMIRIYNKLNALVWLAMIPIIIYDLSQGYLPGFFIALGIFLINSTSFLLIRHGYFNLVKWTSILMVMVNIDFLIIVFGQKSGGELTLMAIGLSCIIFFRSWRARVTLISLIYISYFFTQLYLFFEEPLDPEADVQLIYLIIFITNFLVMVSLVLFFNRQESEHEAAMKALMGDLQVKNHDLQEANFELSQFAFAASHHFKSPLKNISSLLGLIQRRIPESEIQNQKILNMAITDARHLYRMVEDLLTYSRVDATVRVRHLSSADLQKIVDRMAANLKDKIHEAKGRLVLKSLPALVANEAHLEQMFQILVENGLQYNDSEQPVIAISGASHPDGSVTIHVTDNGIGIPEKYHDKILDMFGRLHTQDTYTGTGVGLTICKRIMTSYGGNILIDSQPGKGTTMTLLFLSANQESMDQAETCNET